MDVIGGIAVVEHVRYIVLLVVVTCRLRDLCVSF